MINKLDLSREKSSNIYSSLKAKGAKTTPNFKGAGNVAVKVIQKCEKQPMLNIALIDLITAIIPRTIWESCRNLFAGFEAFRRESSGLIVNCLIPGFITLGIAKVLNNGIMGKGKAKMANCWASSDTLKNVTNHYANSESSEAFKDGMKIFKNETHARVYATNYNLLSEASGLDGRKVKQFKDVLSKKEMSSKADMLTRMMFKSENGKLTEEVVEKLPKKRLKVIFKSITKKTHIAKNVKFGNGMVADLDRALTDSHQIVKGIVKERLKPTEVGGFLNRGIKLLKSKSALAMLVILPLAASMQFINRKITEKKSGVKGAPIHEDYGKQQEKIEKSPEQIKKEKKSLLGQKAIAIGSMLTLAMLSMMKLPTKNTLKNIVQFKGQFPTMDQARAISAVTFSSRMAAADDKTELKEHQTRDLVTFASMYFLGDYGAKGAATIMEKKHGIELMNRAYDVSKNKGPLTKFKNWVLNTHLKSSDELKGTGELLATAKKLRAKAQFANLGTSLLLLGVVVPLYTMSKTKKRDRAEKERIMREKEKMNTLSQQKTKYIASSLYQPQNQQFQSLKTFKTKVKEAK